MPTPEAPAPEVLVEDNMCCGYKRCPLVRALADGTVTVEDNGHRVEFTSDQADRLEAVLAARRAKIGVR